MHSTRSDVDLSLQKRTALNDTRRTHTRALGIPSCAQSRQYTATAFAGLLGPCLLSQPLAPLRQLSVPVRHGLQRWRQLVPAAAFLGNGCSEHLCQTRECACGEKRREASQTVSRRITSRARTRAYSRKRSFVSVLLMSANQGDTGRGGGGHNRVWVQLPEHRPPAPPPNNDNGSGLEQPQSRLPVAQAAL